MTPPCSSMNYFIHFLFLSIYRFFIKFFFLLWPQVRCGRKPCMLQSDSGEPQRPLCPLGQECVAHHFLSCLRPPCSQLGICSTSERLLQPISTQCLPNNGYRDDNCAHVTLVFDSDSVPQVRGFHLVNAESIERHTHLINSHKHDFQPKHQHLWHVRGVV